MTAGKISSTCLLFKMKRNFSFSFNFHEMMDLTNPISLENRLRIRPDGFVWKKYIRALVTPLNIALCKLRDERIASCIIFLKKGRFRMSQKETVKKLKETTHGKEDKTATQCNDDSCYDDCCKYVNIH